MLSQIFHQASQLERGKTDSTPDLYRSLLVFCLRFSLLEAIAIPKLRFVIVTVTVDRVRLDMENVVNENGGRSLPMRLLALKTGKEHQRLPITSIPTADLF